jgi:hypothetical protein
MRQITDRVFRCSKRFSSIIAHQKPEEQVRCARKSWQHTASLPSRNALPARPHSRASVQPLQPVRATSQPLSSPLFSSRVSPKLEPSLALLGNGIKHNTRMISHLGRAWPKHLPILKPELPALTVETPRRRPTVERNGWTPLGQ